MTRRASTVRRPASRPALNAASESSVVVQRALKLHRPPSSLWCPLAVIAVACSAKVCYVGMVASEQGRNFAVLTVQPACCSLV